MPEVIGLVEFDLSSQTHLILIGLCYAFGLCHFFKSCALPPSLLYYTLILSSARPTMQPYSLLEGQPGQLALGREMLYNIQSLQIFRPSSSMFPTTRATTASSQWTCQGGRQAHNVCEKSIFWWHPFKGNWVSRDNVCHCGSQLCRPFGPKPLPHFS